MIQMLRKIIAVAGFAFIGGALREWLELLLPFSQHWVGTTILINVVGAFLLAMINIWLAERLPLPSEIILGLGTGMIGAFTTFSSFSLETIKLMASSHALISVWYLILSISGGLIAASFGYWLANRWISEKMEVDRNEL